MGIKMKKQGSAKKAAQEAAPSDKAQKSSSYSLDFSAPASSSLIKVEDFVEYLKDNMKVNKLKKNLGDKVKIETKGSLVTVNATNVKCTKRACRYYARRYLKKVDLRDRYVIVAKNPTSYEVCPFKASSND
uniref:Large ribosomal subunit protein eL22 n=1 Tax=Coptotermes formosanus TaxID=36987 RepID=R4V1A1_COPFO|nr:60S ribosomal protein L22-1 [Coptotermes formosanus]